MFIRVGASLLELAMKECEQRGKAQNQVADAQGNRQNTMQINALGQTT